MVKAATATAVVLALGTAVMTALSGVLGGASEALTLGFCGAGLCASSYALGRGLSRTPQGAEAT